MAQPEAVVKVKLDTSEARRQVRRLRNTVREVDQSLARLEASLDTNFEGLREDLQPFGIRLEVEAR